MWFDKSHSHITSKYIGCEKAVAGKDLNPDVVVVLVRERGSSDI